MKRILSIKLDYYKGYNIINITRAWRPDGDKRLHKQLRKYRGARHFNRMAKVLEKHRPESVESIYIWHT